MTVLQGDCRTLLASRPEGSVQTCVTSPPYWGLRDYGVDGQLGLEPTPDEYVARMVDVFRAVRRVLADDGTLWRNLGDSYAANRSYQVASTKGGAKHSPAQDALGASSVAAGLKPKDLVGTPWRVAFALQSDGWYLRSDIIWHALAALYQAQGRQREQLAVLEEQIGRADSTARAGLHTQAARIARELGLALEATGHLRAALALPSLAKIERVETLRELAAVWRSLGRTDLALAASEQELAALDPDAPVFAERRRTLRFELAAQADELGRVDAAVAQLCALLDLEQEGGERLETAKQLLLGLLRRNDDCVELERRLESRLTRRNAEEDGEAWLELARLRRERFRRPVAAAAAYREALRRAPAPL